MSGWILNIVGMVFIGVVLEVILPTGKTNAFIKSVFAIFVLYVIVSPLPKLFNATLDLQNTNSTVTDTNYLININLAKVSALETDLVKKIDENGFENVSVIISANIYSNELKISKIYVDLLNLVLFKMDEHINTHEEIKNIIISTVSVNGEDIVFYG